MLALTETKLKGKREVSWSLVSVIFAGVQEMERAREAVNVLMNDIWHSEMEKYWCVSSRILWIKFKFYRVKVYVVVAYGPSEGDSEERDFGTTFWTGLWMALGMDIDCAFWDF